MMISIHLDPMALLNAKDPLYIKYLLDLLSFFADASRGGVGGDNYYDFYLFDVIYYNM